VANKTVKKVTGIFARAVWAPLVHLPPVPLTVNVIACAYLVGFNQDKAPWLVLPPRVP
jgi:hypothetical protein